MKKFVLALVAVGAAGGFLYMTQPRAGVPEGMYNCSQDSECVAVQGVCDAWSAIRKGYENEWKDYVGRIAPLADCAPSRQGKSATAVCRAGRCEAVIQK